MNELDDIPLVDLGVTKSRHPNIIKEEIDERYKDMNKVKLEIKKLEESIRFAENRKAFSNVNRMKDKLITTNAKRESIQRDLDMLVSEAYKSWTPRKQAIETDSNNTVE